MRLLLLLSVLVLAGCGGEETSPSPSGSAMGVGLSIEEALESDLEGPLLVRGYLAERDGELRLCSGLRESAPPQCVDPSLRVEGDVEVEGEAEVKLLGDVEDGTLLVGSTATG